MATPLKKLVADADAGFDNIRVPEGFSSDVRRDNDVRNAVERSAYTLSDLFVAAEQDYLKALFGKTKSTPDLDRAVDIIRRRAIESKPVDGDVPPVMDDIASAMMSVGPEFRSTLLNRAEAGGAPVEVFRPLAQGDMESGSLDPRSPEMSSAVRSDLRNLGPTRDKLPLMATPSSHFRKLGKGKDSYKDMEPSDASALDDAKDPNEPGISESEKRKRERVRDYQLRRLAGDQIAQTKKGRTNLPPVTKDTVYDSDTVLTAGTGASGASPGGSPPDPNRRFGGGRSKRTIDSEVESRNQSQQARAMSRMYELTDPERPEVAESSTLDLDAYFPWWRSRFGDVLPPDRVEYPDMMLTPEAVTHMIQGLYNIHDGNFYNRMLPLVRRSWNAAPDTLEAPTPVSEITRSEDAIANLTPQEKSQYFKELRESSRANRKFAKFVEHGNKTYEPGPTFRKTLGAYRSLQGKAMRPGSREMQQFSALRAKLFGDAPAYEMFSNRPRAIPPAPPAPAKQTPAQAPITETQKAGADAIRARIRARKAGGGDQASIYNVPDRSPLRRLIA